MTDESEPENKPPASNCLQGDAGGIGEIETRPPAERERLFPMFLGHEEKKPGLWARLRGL